MATEYIHKECYEAELRVITLSRKEVVDMIGFLVADLAGETLSGNASGAPATFNVVERGAIKYRLILSAERESATSGESASRSALIAKRASPAICSMHGAYELQSGCIECLNEVIIENLSRWL